MSTFHKYPAFFLEKIAKYREMDLFLLKAGWISMCFTFRLRCRRNSSLVLISQSPHVTVKSEGLISLKLTFLLEWNYYITVNNSSFSNDSWANSSACREPKNVHCVPKVFT